MIRTEITIKDIFQALLRRIVFILLMVLVFGVASFVFTKIFVPESYTAIATLYAYSNLDRSKIEISTSEQNASRQLVDTYTVLLKSDAVLGDVADTLAEKYDLHYSSSYLAGIVSAASKNETEVFEVRVLADSPEHAKLIADTVADVASVKIAEIVGSGGVKIVDYSKQPSAPTYPDTKDRTIAGGLLGLLVGCVVAILRMLFDTTFWTEEDLERQYHIPVLGTIPPLDDTDISSKKARG